MINIQQWRLTPNILFTCEQNAKDFHLIMLHLPLVPLRHWKHLWLDHPVEEDEFYSANASEGIRSAYALRALVEI